MTEFETYEEREPLDPESVDFSATSDDRSQGDGASPPEPIDAANLLERILAFVRRFVCLPSEHADFSVVLWAAHTHLMDAWDTTPRLAFLSAEPGSGKSRAMEITALLAPLALEAANATTASLIRALDDPAGRPTFFIDEIDTKYGPKAKGDEELRAMINAGHRRGGFFMRCEIENDQWVPVRREAFAAIGMAGIGEIPDTILSRSIIVSMRKRAPDENVDPYRQREHKDQGHALRDELAAWADQVCAQAAKCRPTLPDGIFDRDADVWEPLIIVADLAGGPWPARAREAALGLLAARKAGTKPSLGIQLLSDIQDCFGSDNRLPTKELLRRLLADPLAPWGNLSGRKLDDRSLGELLRPYGITSVGIRLPDKSTPKGYRPELFHDAWKRYLPSSAGAATSATAATDSDNPREWGDSDVADDSSSPSCGGSGGGDGGSNIS